MSEAPTDAAGSRRARVLVVDDERTIAQFIGELLEFSGYDALVHTDPMAALEAVRAAGGAIDLVVSDQTMPGMVGTDLAARIHELAPDVPVILCSGYNDVVNPDNAPEHGLARYLNKPVDAARLVAIVAEVLAQARPR
ncbi:MAG: response regulator [Ectothiorhodospiraceae bacterium]|nr:response regulator [Chromatiales bacterium]MCP5156774.1 response regulator [Ectothiorhodospiraceae bacterium]